MVRLAALALAAGLGGGAQAVELDPSYLAQSIGGHWQLMRAARPVDELLADPATPAELRQRLELSQRMRDFAVEELALPDNASYRRYAALDRPAAVWNVVAAPELSLKLRTWCFPVVGCVGYRGYYERAVAQAYADTLSHEQPALDVALMPVPAYSTLGKLPGAFFADPLLSTFIRYPEGELARLIFHELAHQVAYAAGDTEFNESYATAVERLGGQQWLAQHAGPVARTEFAEWDARRQDYKALTLRARQRLEAVYASERDDAAKRAAKAQVLQQLRDEHAALKAGPWQGDGRFDAAIARASNATLGLQAAYDGHVPAFIALFEREDRDWPRFHAEVRRLAGLPVAERRATLKSLMP
ncbi:aminopeptidase [Rivibacter subsaxonicus]|uniref:aminopeptidase n=1 Tax=Rivibacter subsaxonicus TaxID=457575 RepID=UPI001F5F957E|nr:aminopeptidase [Rivibacter subsaxonicus]